MNPPVTPAPYLAEIHATLPRLLALYDTNALSSTYGFGDRMHWAWRVLDFPNATYQGTVNGLARLLASDALPSGIAPASILDRIDAQFEAFVRMRDRDGSVGEAYPHEASFCVSALVLFDMLSALELLGERMAPAQRARWLDVLAPTARFVAATPETHGFIANHLATGAAALARWRALTGEHAKVASESLERILASQTDEGWYPEYGGADPGYQSLCLYYLADLHARESSPRLADSLRRALSFMRWFAHPDGSYGGDYGWRGTRFLCPAGLEMLAPEFADARWLAAFVRGSITRQRIPTLGVFDDSNLPVMFNAWTRAAVAAVELDEPETAAPAAQAETRHHFEAAGLVVDSGPRHHTIVSWRRGGAFVHFRDGRLAARSGGIVARDAAGCPCSSQTLHRDVVAHLEGDSIEIDCPLRPIDDRPPPPWQFAVLRLLAISVFRWAPLNRAFKRFAARFLLEGLARPCGRARRRLRIGTEFSVTDTLLDGSLTLDASSSARAFNARRMASQGYWQCQDDER